MSTAQKNSEILAAIRDRTPLRIGVTDSIYPADPVFPVAGTIYLAELFIPSHLTITGIAVYNFGPVGTSKRIVALFDSDGALVANSALAGTLSSGEDAWQEIAFTAPYTVEDPGVFYVGVQADDATDPVLMVPSGYVGMRSKSSTGAFGTLPTQTVPTTFTADTAPMAYAYT